MKKVIFGVLALVVGLAVIAVGRTLVLFAGASDAATAQATPVTPRQFEAGDAPEHLAEAISYPTISWGGAQPRDDEAFDSFAEFLTRAYPNANRVMERHVVNGHSLVYRWKGPTRRKGRSGFLLISTSCRSNRARRIAGRIRRLKASSLTARSGVAARSTTRER